MQRHQVRRLPVIDGHKLVGMLSQADTARHTDEHRTAPPRPGEMVSEISEP